MSRVLAALAGLAAACGVIGQFGRVSVVADLVNFAAPFWLAGGAFAGAGALLLRPSRRARALAGWSLVLLGGLAALLFAPDLTPGPRCAGPALTVAQFNMWKSNPDPRTGFAWLEGSDADLLLVEEAAPGTAARLRAHYPHYVSCAVGCSTMILSRLPLRARGGLARSDPENRLGLSAAWAEVAGPGGPFTIVVAHFDRPWPFNGNAWNRASLSQFVRTRDPATTVVGGDFNLPAWSFQNRALAAGLGLRRLTGILSWPAPHPVLAIDHLFAGAGWGVERIMRGPTLGSDHYPLLARLRRCG